MAKNDFNDDVGAYIYRLNENKYGSNGNKTEVWTCCNDEQTLFFLLYIAFVALAFVTWNSMLAKPMRLVAVFLHEMSHAIACWLTGGTVLEIQVYENEGGVTRYMRGLRWLIIPAGYLGCGFWAMVFVILSSGRKTATFAAVLFVITLLITLRYSPNKALVSVCCGYAIITLVFIALEWYYITPILNFLILFYGVFIGIYAVADLHEGTVFHSIEGSDTYACYKEVWNVPYCKPRCIGIQWTIICLLQQLVALWISLVEMSEECDELNWFECLNLSVDIDEFSLFKRNWSFEGFWNLS